MKLKIAVLACLITIAGCNPQPRSAAHTAMATPSPTAAGLPPLRITGRGTKRSPIRIFEQSGNRKLYEGTALSLISHSALNVAHATFAQTTVTFYDKDGTSLTAAAPQAVLDQNTKQIMLSGGVKARTSSGATLTCSTLAYDSRTERINGQGNVRITALQNGSQEVLTGNTFTSDIKLTQMVMR